MDGEYIEIHKKGSSKGLNVNTTLLTACNPTDDFFLEEINFRKQLPFKEGVLSRFDILIPLTATQLKNELLVDRIDLFGTGPETPIDFEEIKGRLVTLSKGMQQIKFVVLTEEQKKTLRDIFKAHNTADRKHRYIKNRPLVILRDLESLARLVNVITTVNFSKRKVENGILHADDKDIDKAIQLWENLLVFRIQLYARSSRNLMTVSDEILAYLARMGGSDSWIPVEEALNEFVMVQHKVGRTTFYREITGLIEEGRIIATNKRNRKIRLVIK
jgi:DNA replicative helicase MCM subunit Mcm2 (Cdc46/Mcm family)